MRIISSFKDIYDNLQSPTQPVYVRETSDEYLVDKYPKEVFSFKSPSSINGILVGFCGKIYFAYYREIVNNPHQYEVWYTAESLLKDYPDVIKIGHRKHPNYTWYFDYNRRDFLEYRKDQFNEFMGFGIPEDRTKIFMKHFSSTCPFFVIIGDGRDQHIIQNPTCKKYELYKLFPVQQIFQEIEMYLGSLAHPEKNIPVVSDPDMITAKGFDKWSFRKEPTKVKR